MKTKQSPKRERSQENLKLLELGANIRKLRQERGWTQTELARRAGLDQTYISGLEIGRRDPNPSLLSVTRIATALRESTGTLCNKLER